MKSRNWSDAPERKLAIKFSIFVWLIVILEMVSTYAILHSEPISFRDYTGFLALFAGQVSIGFAPFINVLVFRKLIENNEGWFTLIIVSVLGALICAILFKIGWLIILVKYYGKNGFSGKMINSGIVVISFFSFWFVMLEFILLRRLKRSEALKSKTMGNLRR